jgi:hypothetical protein
MTSSYTENKNLPSTAATTSSLPKPEFLYSVPEGAFALDLTYRYMNKSRHFGNINLFLITITINQVQTKSGCPQNILSNPYFAV